MNMNEENKTENPESGIQTYDRKKKSHGNFLKIGCASCGFVAVVALFSVVCLNPAFRCNIGNYIGNHNCQGNIGNHNSKDHSDHSGDNQGNNPCDNCRTKARMDRKEVQRHNVHKHFKLFRKKRGLTRIKGRFL